MTSPVALIRADRIATLLALLATAAGGVVLVPALFGAAWLVGLLDRPPPLAAQLSAGLGFGLALWILRRCGAAWIRFTTARLPLAALGLVPFRLLRFLTFGEKVGLLRNLGGSYRFRHGQMQGRLARDSGHRHSAARQEDFATELARAGYWDEALAIFGAILAARSVTVGINDDLTAAALRRAVLIGCVGGRWRRTGAYLATLPAPAASRPQRQAVATRRARVADLVEHDAPLAALLTACDELLEVEAGAGSGRAELPTLEFRAAVLLAAGETGEARRQLRRIATTLRFGPGRDGADRPTPIASALLARLALAAGAADRAMAICQYELLPRESTSDLALPAESWRWSIRILGRVWDEEADLSRRLSAALARQQPPGQPATFGLTRRDLIEMGLAACNTFITHPMLGGLSLVAARRLAAEMANQEAYRFTIDRSAPMWYTAHL